MEPKQTRVCIRCNQEKELEDFGRSARSADGFKRTCRSCHRAIRRGKMPSARILQLQRMVDAAVAAGKARENGGK